jgi:hypothetical protein
MGQESLMATRSLDGIVSELWPELLRAEGLPDVDEETVRRLTRTTVPSLRAARDRGAPDYASAAAVRGQVVEILNEARYRTRPERDTAVTDFLDQKRREITERLDELKPAVDEYSRLEAAASALAGFGGAAATAAPRRRGPGRPRGSASRKVKAKAAASPAKAARKKAGRPASKPRSGRRKGSGTRAAEALALVQAQPGITIPELAAKMGIKQNYLYRVLPGLEKEKKVTKQGRGWHPRG